MWNLKALPVFTIAPGGDDLESLNIVNDDLNCSANTSVFLTVFGISKQISTCRTSGLEEHFGVSLEIR